MKKLSLAIVLLTAPMMAQAWPWSRDMTNQISVKPQEPVDTAKPAPNPYPARSVPAPGTVTSSISVKDDMDAVMKLSMPADIKNDAKSAEKGRQLFTIYCTPCHGHSGTGNGMVGAKFMVPPADLTSDALAEQPDGYIFGKMTFGWGLMPVYANDLSPAERWHVVNYIRKGLHKASAAQAETSAK
jgi:mono/diheme cytochrome c family protein